MWFPYTDGIHSYTMGGSQARWQCKMLKTTSFYKHIMAYIRFCFNIVIVLFLYCNSCEMICKVDEIRRLQTCGDK